MKWNTQSEPKRSGSMGDATASARRRINWRGPASLVGSSRRRIAVASLSASVSQSCSLARSSSFLLVMQLLRLMQSINKNANRGGHGADLIAPGANGGDIDRQITSRYAAHRSCQ